MPEADGQDHTCQGGVLLPPQHEGHRRDRAQRGNDPENQTKTATRTAKHPHSEAAPDVGG